MLIFVEEFASGLKVLAATGGNERMALATYSEMNGFTRKFGEVEETAMVLRAAAKVVERCRYGDIAQSHSLAVDASQC